LPASLFVCASTSLRLRLLRPQLKRDPLDSHNLLSMTTLHVGVDSWIIQDGNYPDFRSGQEATFALEFVPTLERVSDPGEPRLHHQQGGVYSARGRVVFAERAAWVCDFGVLAYRSDNRPPWATVGASVGGEIYLGIDPFDYVERLHKLPGMPALAYRFSIARIWLETTPWVQETDLDGRQFRRRKDGPPTFREVAATDAWKDDDTFAHYLLECQPQGAAV